MNLSPSIAHLALALSSFQAEVNNPSKSSINPHFKSKYASFDEIVNTIRPTLSKHGLSFMQNPAEKEGAVGVSTIILHKSGEFMQFDPVFIPLKQSTPHQVGSAMTYARRYSLSAALGIATEEDDDGNGSDSTREKKEEKTENVTYAYTPPAWHDSFKFVDHTSFERKRFFALCNKMRLTDKQQRAIVYLFTGKSSRKDITSEEFNYINLKISEATRDDVLAMIKMAMKRKLEAGTVSRGGDSVGNPEKRKAQ